MRKWVSQWFDLPPDVTSEVPRIEMIGSYRLQIENHRGIAYFSHHEIKIKWRQGLILISGKQLKIRAIYPEIIQIEGAIYGLRYLDQ